jgi:hypothetical protein
MAMAEDPFLGSVAKLGSRAGRCFRLIAAFGCRLRISDRDGGCEGQERKARLLDRASHLLRDQSPSCCSLDHRRGPDAPLSLLPHGKRYCSLV